MTERRISRLPVDTGTSGWLALSERTMPVRVLEGKNTADWLVIGAGFAGLSAARRLTQLCPGDRIAVLDAKEVGEGPAGRNSGFMVNLPHILSSGKLSAEGADQVGREIVENNHALSFAQAAAEEYGLDRAVFDPAGKTNAAATEGGERQNARFALSLDRIGETYERLDAKAMKALTGSSYYRSGLWTPGTIMIQPAVYVRTLAAALGRVCDIYERSPVTSLRRTGGVWVAETPHGVVQAPKAILAVNGHVEDFGHFQGSLIHIFTYASMTAALRPGMDGRGRTGEAAWGLLPADPMGATVRKISAADGERVVIRTRFTFDPSLRVSTSRVAKIAAEQRRSFDARYPDLGNVPFEYSWAGRLCLSVNNVPAFGEVDENLFSACCCNGLGTVKSTLAGILAADLATGTGSALLDRYGSQPAPRRLPPPPVARLGINSVIRLRQFRAGRES